MTTVLFYLVIAAVIGLVVFFLAVLVFGRGEQMAPLDPRTSPAELPDHDIDSEDVRKIRFALALRGYRMSDVDWTLERLSEQIDSLRLENAQLRGRLSDPDQPATTDGQAPDLDDLDTAADADDQERWGPPQHTPPGREPAQPEASMPHEQLSKRYADRTAAPAVDR